ncbi:MAG: YiiD C-terminal domain-containing protein [Wenzhouxiangellaceae bacterium]|nr:YiiD C-terminal domain-containing protein [Wenzhouxiangellaceae bacterium]
MTNEAATGSAEAEEICWLEPVLTEQIPLGAAMALNVKSLDHDGIILAAPLAPNVNDKGTAFGGALVSMMILAGWSLPRLLLRRHAIAAELVIGRCQVRFLKPVDGPFQAHCRWPAATDIETFVNQLRHGGRARLELAPEIIIDGEVAARLEARYAALTKIATGD